MATTKKANWDKVLANYTERFKEICSILSDNEKSMQVTREKNGFTLCMDDGQIISEQLTESQLDGIIRSLWLMAGESEMSRSVASFFVLKTYNDFIMQD